MFCRIVSIGNWNLDIASFILFQSDRIYDSALDLKWNEMPLNGQHLYKFFIHRCQNPTLLTVGGFAKLNLNTCVTVRIIWNICEYLNRFKKFTKKFRFSQIFARIYNITMIIYTMLVHWMNIDRPTTKQIYLPHKKLYTKILLTNTLLMFYQLHKFYYACFEAIKSN